MKLSEINADSLDSLSVDKLTSLVFGDYTDDGKIYDAIILCGGICDLCRERSAAAAELYKLGRAKAIIASGGVEWDSPFGKLSEAEIMRRYLIELGVDEAVIFTDNEAKSTLENIICSSLQIQRNIGFKEVSSVAIVTSFWHLRRAYALAKVFLPSCVEISAWHSQQNQFDSPTEWTSDELHVRRVKKEARILKHFYDEKIISDIEF